MQIDGHPNPKKKVAPVEAAYQQETKRIESLLMQVLSLYHKVAMSTNLLTCLFDRWLNNAESVLEFAIRRPSESCINPIVTDMSTGRYLKEWRFTNACSQSETYSNQHLTTMQYYVLVTMDGWKLLSCSVCEHNPRPQYSEWSSI